MGCSCRPDCHLGPCCCSEVAEDVGEWCVWLSPALACQSGKEDTRSLSTSFPLALALLEKAPCGLDVALFSKVGACVVIILRSQKLLEVWWTSGNRVQASSACHDSPRQLQAGAQARRRWENVRRQILMVLGRISDKPSQMNFRESKVIRWEKKQDAFD